jgi:hypothetical protein
MNSPERVFQVQPVDDQHVPFVAPGYDVTARTVTVIGSCYVYCIDFLALSSDGNIVLGNFASQLPRWWKIVVPDALTYSLIFRAPGRIVGLLQPPSSGTNNFGQETTPWGYSCSWPLASFTNNSATTLKPLSVAPMVAWPAATRRQSATVVQKQANAAGAAGFTALGGAGLNVAQDVYISWAAWPPIGSGYTQQSAAAFIPRNNVSPLYLGARFTGPSGQDVYVMSGDLATVAPISNGRINLVQAIKRPTTAWLLRELCCFFPVLEEGTNANTYKYWSICAEHYDADLNSVITPGGTGATSAGLGSVYGLSGAPSPSYAVAIAGA